MYGKLRFPMQIVLNRIILQKSELSKQSFEAIVFPNRVCEQVGKMYKDMLSGTYHKLQVLLSDK